MEFGIIIDGSESIEKSGKGNFEKVLRFVKSLAIGLKVSKEGTHVGLICYSDKSKVGLFTSNRLCSWQI